MSVSVQVHQSIDTCYHADSVEWCPVQNLQDIMLCGTYQLQEKQQTDESQVRVGRLTSYTLECTDTTRQLTELQQHPTQGILDVKWSRDRLEGHVMFALVTSVGQLEVYSIDEDTRQFHKVTATELSPDSLGLSLDWSSSIQTRPNDRITSSDSAGHVHVHQLTGHSLHTLTSWKAHDYEAWITAFDRWNPDVVYTGGDDCRLKAWDLRMDPTTAILNSKRHSMGVCSIQSNPVKEHILATGSYDETLLIWDTRCMKQPLSELGLGGGIWRIKWEPHTASHILTATMYNGFHLIHVTDTHDLTMVHNYKEHDSIGYGIDWCRIQDSSVEKPSNNHTIASCSFYDHLLTLWSYSEGGS